MGEPLENLYFNWLCAKVVDSKVKSPSRTYWELLKILQRTEFVWLLSGDDNRAEDGKELRRDFLLEADLPDDIEWRLNIECSMLEMLIAFSKRANFETDIPVKDWFWIFMDNLSLKDCNDSNIDPQDVVEILERLIWRMYDLHGNGGMFPILYPNTDQREVEIWYQFCDYIAERE